MNTLTSFLIAGTVAALAFPATADDQSYLCVTIEGQHVPKEADRICVPIPPPPEGVHVRSCTPLTLRVLDRDIGYTVCLGR